MSTSKSMLATKRIAELLEQTKETLQQKAIFERLNNEFDKSILVSAFANINRNPSKYSIRVIKRGNNVFYQYLSNKGLTKQELIDHIDLLVTDSKLIYDNQVLDIQNNEVITSILFYINKLNILKDQLEQE